MQTLSKDSLLIISDKITVMEIDRRYFSPFIKNFSDALSAILTTIARSKFLWINFDDDRYGDIYKHEDVAALTEIIKTNSSLMYFSYNLQYNPSTEWREWSFADRDIKDSNNLAAAIGNNTNLIYLGISGYYVPEACLDAYAQAISHNNLLLFFTPPCNKGGEVARKTLAYIEERIKINRNVMLANITKFRSNPLSLNIDELDILSKQIKFLAYCIQNKKEAILGNEEVAAMLKQCAELYGENYLHAISLSILGVQVGVQENINNSLDLLVEQGVLVGDTTKIIVEYFNKTVLPVYNYNSINDMSSSAAAAATSAAAPNKRLRHTDK